MAMRYRSRTDIVAQIVQIAVAAEGKGVTRSHIGNKGSLTLKQMKEYIPILTEEGFLMDYYDNERNERLYKATEKGIKFLRLYHHLDAYLSTVMQN
jgi:predicted transcriptional regulator